jgi:hypothetical protein
MTEQNIEAITAALQAVNEKNVEYQPLHAAYLTAMSTSGAYEPVPEYVPKTGELVTPEVIISMIATGEATKTGISNAVTAGKIRKITAVKSAELIAKEAALTAALSEYERICREAVAAISVKKSPKKTGTSGTKNPAESEAGQRAVRNILALDPEAKIFLEGRRVMGTLSNGAQIVSPQGPGFDFYATAFQSGVPEGIRKALLK